MSRSTPFIVPTLFILGILAAGCAVEQNGADYDTDGAQMDIEAVNQRFETFVAGQQWDSLMTLYTDDAIMMPQGAPMAEGNAIRDGFAQMGRMGVSGINLETVDVEVAGNTAYEVGRYTLEGPNGMEIDEGKYLVVWKNVDGEWKLHRDAFNTDLPAPPTSEGMPSDTLESDTAAVDTASVI